MKKTMILTSMALMSLVAVGCANEEVKDTQDNQPVISTNMEEVQTEGNANTKKPLIVYFSYGENSELPQDVDASASASIQKWNDENTGNTGIVAHIIQEKTKGDMFSVQTVNKYPSTYNETVDQGKREHENNIRPELANHITNLDDYDTIFVGYPNWWYDMPMAMYSFFDEYDLSNSTIQLSGESSSSTESENVMIRTVDLEEQERKEVMAALTDKLGSYQVLREEKVGATMGTELIMNAIYATIISWLLIIAYVSYRFEFKFGISAVLGLAHNVIIVLGAFALTQRQIDSSFVAALLTIIGYSINDTIVIFDRIRENLKLHFRKNGDIVELVNTSIYQTMTRSIYTVSTVLFATFALYFFGGDTTKDFAFALLIGFFCGAYTSIFIASPLWVTFRRYSDKKRLAKRMADTGK